MEAYYAHIAEDGRKQSVKEHLMGTAKRAVSCLASAGFEKTAYLAGLIHDMGKFTSAFQEYIKNADCSKRGSVIHTFQGCRYFLELETNNNERSLSSAYTAELLAFAAGAHHGLFDCVDNAGNSGMQYRVEKDNTFYQEAFAGIQSQVISDSKVKDLFYQASKEIELFLNRIETTYEKDDEYCFQIGLLARLLLSAVIEGDRYDTAVFMNCNVKPPEKTKDMRPLWEDRLNYMETKLSEFSCDTPVDKARRAISNQCRDFAKQPKGIYRLNVPTGGGKTLSSLRYALAHAEQFNKKRLIFISPLLSILEQNAAVIREFVGDDSLILEHHSNVIQTEQTQEQLDERELLVQNWNSPIIITTLVQLLNCMFDGKTSSVRRFQALCDSVIVIDEVQTIPAKLLSLFNLTIRFLAEQCGTTVVLSSATQPCLEELSHTILPIPKDIVPYDAKIWNVFKRTQLTPMKSMQLDQLPDFIRSCMEEKQSFLVVCNKKDEAAYLFEQTESDNYASFHLSASMCMQHRRDTVSALRESFKQRKTLCISTQVIEAGVDISFQQVLRLTAGMDSIVQSAGRCNRNAESSEVCPVYIINCSNENLGRLHDIQQGKTATIALLNAYKKSPDQFKNDLSSDNAIAYYYKAFFSDMNNKAQDYPLPKIGTTILDLISENQKFTASRSEKLKNCALRQAFKTAGECFSVFGENTIDVLVPYGAGEQLISQLCSACCYKDLKYRGTLLKQASNYTISLYDYQFRQLDNLGALYRICEDSVLVLRPEYYDNRLGAVLNKNNYAFLEV